MFSPSSCCLEVDGPHSFLIPPPFSISIAHLSFLLHWQLSRRCFPVSLPTPPSLFHNNPHSFFRKDTQIGISVGVGIGVILLLIVIFFWVKHVTKPRTQTTLSSL